MSFEADIKYNLQVVFLELTLKERKDIMQSFRFDLVKEKIKKLQEEFDNFKTE